MFYAAAAKPNILMRDLSVFGALEYCLLRLIKLLDRKLFSENQFSFLILNIEGFVSKHNELPF